MSVDQPALSAELQAASPSAGVPLQMSIDSDLTSRTYQMAVACPGRSTTTTFTQFRPLPWAAMSRVVVWAGSSIAMEMYGDVLGMEWNRHVHIVVG